MKFRKSCYISVISLWNRKQTLPLDLPYPITPLWRSISVVRGQITEILGLQKTACWKLSKQKTGYVLIWNCRGHSGLSTHVKKSIYSYGSFQKYSVVFQRSSKKPIFGLFLRKAFAYENMLLGLGYQTVKTAGLYLVPIKSYSKNNWVPYFLERIITVTILTLQKKAVWHFSL